MKGLLILSNLYHAGKNTPVPKARPEGGEELVPPLPHSLTLQQRIVLKLKGFVYVGHYKKASWRGYLPFYAFNCKRHGLQFDYPHGHEEKLTCCKCFIQHHTNPTLNGRWIKHEKI